MAAGRVYHKASGYCDARRSSEQPDFSHSVFVVSAVGIFPVPRSRVPLSRDNKSLFQTTASPPTTRGFAALEPDSHLGGGRFGEIPCSFAVFHKKDAETSSDRPFTPPSPVDLAALFGSLPLRSTKQSRDGIKAGANDGERSRTWKRLIEHIGGSATEPTHVRQAS